MIYRILAYDATCHVPGCYIVQANRIPTEREARARLGIDKKYVRIQEWDGPQVWNLSENAND